MQLFALPTTHTHAHTRTHVRIDKSDRRGSASSPPPTLLGNSQQLHFMRTELDTQVRHANIFALELPRVVQLPKGQLGASWADRAKEAEEAWLRERGGAAAASVTAAVCMQIFALTAFA